MVRLSETSKSQIIYNRLKIGTFQPKISKNCFFDQNSPPLDDVMQTEIDILEFLQIVKFESIDSLESNVTKYLLVFSESWEETRIPKAFVDFATAERHSGLSTIYDKHLFHQIRLWGRNTKIVHSRPPLDVMRVTTLSARLGFGSKIVDWYRDAANVPYGHFVDFSLPTGDRLRYYTNTGSITSKFYIPDRLEQSKLLDDEVAKSLYSLSVPIILQQMQKPFPSVLSKRVYPASLRMHSKSQRKPEKHKTTSRDVVWKRSSTAVSKKNHFKAKKGRSGIWKRQKNSWKSLLFPPLTICLDMEICLLIVFEYSDSCKAGASKVSSWTKSHVPNWFDQKGNKQKTVCQSRL